MWLGHKIFAHNVHACKYVTATSMQCLSGFSGVTDMLIYIRVAFRSSSIISVSGKDNRLKGILPP